MASLHRIRRWALVIAGVCCLLPTTLEAAEPTMFYVVRHAERPEAGDPDTDRLTPAGHERARQLRDLLQLVPLSAIYVTDQRRTQQTAAPTASHQGVKAEEARSATGQPLHDNQAVRAWAEALPARHAGQNVLIVTHSPLIAPIVEALSGAADVPRISGDPYSSLWTVSLDDRGAAVSRSRYGIEVLRTLLFEDGVDNLKGSNDLSAVVVAGDVLVVASDEDVPLSDEEDEETEETESVIQMLSKQSDTTWRVESTIRLVKNKETDTEAMALVDRTLYVAGSHSRGRRKANRADYAENRIRFSERQDKKPRQVLYRLDLDTQMRTATPRGQIDLRKILASDEMSGQEILTPFLELPSKENGLDAEGLAADDEWLHVGFRGPVLSGGYVPVLKLKFDPPHEPELLFVTLGGQGIRSLERTADGFLIIAGPVNDAPGTYHLYHWDGNDCIPGTRPDGAPPQGRITPLGIIPTPPRAKPEGLAVLNEAGAHYELLIVYDGPSGGSPRVLRASKP